MVLTHLIVESVVFLGSIKRDGTCPAHLADQYLLVLASFGGCTLRTLTFGLRSSLPHQVIHYFAVLLHSFRLKTNEWVKGHHGLYITSSPGSLNTRVPPSLFLFLEALRLRLYNKNLIAFQTFDLARHSAVYISPVST